MTTFGFTPRVSVSESERESLLTFARETVRTAGAATLPFFRGKLEVQNKKADGFDPVTQADKAAEQVIRQRIEASYPTHGIYGEEFGFKEGNGLTWVIDPIDGTRAFMTGMLHWGVLLALFDGQEPIIGAMYQPYVDDLFLGDGSKAIHLRGSTVHPMQTSAQRELDQAVLGTTGPEWFRTDAARFDRLRNTVKMCRLGGDCYVYAMVALGGLDIGTDGSLNPYDIQALAPIVRGAGGVITTFDGGNPALGGNILCSANAELHRIALDLIQTS